MVTVPDSLRSLFTAVLRERNGTHTVEIPADEITQGAIEVGETYRVALIGTSSRSPATTSTGAETPFEESAESPPVSEGEVREVEISTTGSQGDGIAKVERGFVIIVPEGNVGETPTVRINDVQSNVAFAEIIKEDTKLR